MDIEMESDEGDEDDDDAEDYTFIVDREDQVDDDDHADEDIKDNVDDLEADPFNDFDGDVNEDVQCSVCLVAPPIEPVETKQCKHVFCRWCINEWLKDHTACPYCRCKLKEERSIARPFFSLLDFDFDYENDSEYRSPIIISRRSPSPPPISSFSFFPRLHHLFSFLALDRLSLRRSNLARSNIFSSIESLNDDDPEDAAVDDNSSVEENFCSITIEENFVTNNKSAIPAVCLPKFYYFDCASNVEEKIVKNGLLSRRLHRRKPAGRAFGTITRSLTSWTIIN